MGSIKKQSKKFSTPSHPWQKERIVAEQDLLKGFGLRRKYEVWKMNSQLKNFTKQAKKLITISSEQGEKERSQLLKKLASLGLIKTDARIEDVLGLTVNDIMERRLQTLVYRKNMARSLKQARQFITHQHISVADKKITAPSYLVPVAEENTIQFVVSSELANAEHPERAVAKKPEEKAVLDKKEAKEEKKADKKPADKKEAKPKEEKKAEAKPAPAKEAPKESKEEPAKQAKAEEKKE